MAKCKALTGSAVKGLIVYKAVEGTYISTTGDIEIGKYSENFL